MLSINKCYKKGIFWCCMDPDADFEGEWGYGVWPKVVFCDANGKALEEVKSSDDENAKIDSLKPPKYSSKKGDNFSHKAEWCEQMERVPFDYYPRGRVEVKNSKIKIVASPVIVASEAFREAVCDAFRYFDPTQRKNITWISDKRAYRYVSDVKVLHECQKERLKDKK